MVSMVVGDGAAGVWRGPTGQWSVSRGQCGHCGNSVWSLSGQRSVVISGGQWWSVWSLSGQYGRG